MNEVVSLWSMCLLQDDFLEEAVYADVRRRGNMDGLREDEEERLGKSTRLVRARVKGERTSW